MNEKILTQRTGLKSTNKKFTLYFLLIIFTSTLSCLLIMVNSSWWVIISVIPLTWSVYYLLAFVFSYKYILLNKNNKYSLNSEDEIALIMTVCDDFNFDAANSLLHQEYGKYHVFILDDSKKESNKEEVITWCKKNSVKCTRIFRDNNVGFKAGNLNQAEKKIPDNYKLFCIVDSDQHLHPSFITQIFKKYCENNHPSFVQGIHYGKVEDVSQFSKCLAPMIYAEWKYHIPYKNEYGQTGIGGHGYLIERSVLNDVGGHPEIVSEDLALTMKLSTKRFHGIMSPEIVSMEIYPESYKTIQQRRFRWMVADWEITSTKYFENFLRNTATLPEKFDLFLREIRLPVSSIYFGLTAIATLLTIVTKLATPLSDYSTVIPQSIILPLIILSLSAFYPLIDNSQHTIFDNFRAFFANIFLGASYPSLQVAAGFYYLKKRRATFWVTNANCKKATLNQRLKVSLIFDFIFLILFMTYAYVFIDLLFLAFGIALLARLCFSFFNLPEVEGQIWIFGLLFVVLIMAQVYLSVGLTIIELLLIVAFPFILV